MVKLNQIITLQIILLIMFIYFDYHLYYILYPCTNDVSEYKILKWSYVDDVVNELKNGDLILFSAYEFSLYNRILGHPDYSHIGMIIKTDKLYSLEMIENDYVFPKHEKYKNVNKFDLIDRITNYPGFVYIASYNSNLSNEQVSKLNYISNINFMYPTKYENFKTTFLNNNILCDLYKEGCRSNNKSIHCSNMIAQILLNLNIYHFKNSKPINYHSDIINLCNGEIYSEPIRVISKKNIVNNIYNNNLTYYC